MAQHTEKEQVLEAVEALPANATVEDAMDRLYLLAKVLRGIAQADAGNLVPHDEAKARLLK